MCEDIFETPTRKRGCFVFWGIKKPTGDIIFRSATTVPRLLKEH